MAFVRQQTDEKSNGCQKSDNERRVTNKYFQEFSPQVALSRWANLLIEPTCSVPNCFWLSASHALASAAPNLYEFKLPSPAHCIRYTAIATHSPTRIASRETQVTRFKNPSIKCHRAVDRNGTPNP
jgi:hypothetical protein